MTNATFLIFSAFAKDEETRVKRWYVAWECGLIDAKTAMRGIENEQQKPLASKSGQE